MAYATNESHDALWKQILEHHWKYVESEESMQKIELRRELEDLIEKRLGKVPPNEKFYLDDTRYVFDSSVAHLDDFSAYKASIGFEAISQYANNLFVKPWRKEYKVIKMYSGFYQHEIAANLVNAEKLFQAMGYQLMPNKTLILDGPICPDQVMNVARDAITAYVECQIMKRIYCELTSLRLSVDWIDIYNFRSYHAADAMQMVKQMAAFIQEKHHKKQQAKLRDAYGSSSAALPPASSCNSCNPYQFHVAAGQQQPLAQAQPPPPPVSFCGGGASGASANGVAVGNSSQLYSSAATAVATPSCSIHSQHLQQQQQQQQQQPPPQQAPPANAFGGGAYQPHHPHHLPHHHHHHHLHHSSYGNYGAAPAPALGTMPHSKSLDHYQDANSAAAAAAAAAAMYGMNGVYMQRHSIDQPYHYTGSAMATPYAAAANVAPTPFDGPIDGMLPCGVGGGGGPSTGAPVSCSNNHPYNVPGTARYPPLPYGNYPAALGPPMAGGYMNGGPAKLQNGATLADGCYRHPPMNGYIGATAGYPSQGYRGSSTGMGFLPNCGPSSIYDPASVAGGPAYPPQPSSILSTRKKLYDDYDVPTSSRRLSESKASASGAKKLDRYHKNSELLIDYESDMLPETLVERNQLHHHQQQQQQQQQQQPHHHHHYLHHQTSRNSRQSDFDSYEDEQQESNVSRRISSKNQDGIGCYETWNYVYQNLEKQGYSKDLGERGDFLVDEDEEQHQQLQQQHQRRADIEELDRRERRRMESGSSATLRRSHNEKLKAMKPKSADKVDGIVRNAAESTNAVGSRQRSSTAGAGGSTGTTLVQKMAKASLLSPRTTESVGDGELQGGEPRTKKQSATGGSTGMNANKENNNHPTATSTTATTGGGGGILVNHHNHSNGTVAGGGGATMGSSSASTGGKKKTATFDTGAATIINPTTTTTTAASSSGGNAPSGEWNCNFCTFLNPDVKRICDMCSKSRDFRLDGAATTSNGTAAAAVAATCV